MDTGTGEEHTGAAPTETRQLARAPKAPPPVSARPGPSPDVVVVGGGIVGTSAAAFLAEAGLRVVLVEREGLASGASGANSGVVQHPFDPVTAPLYRSTVHLYRALAATGAGTVLKHEPAGMLFVSEEESAVRRQAASIAGTFPELDVDVVGGDDLARLEPGLAPGLWACRAAIGFPVAPGASTYAYATLAERHGAEVRTGRAARLAMDGDRVVGVAVDGRLVPAGAVLAAAGPGTPELIDPTGQWTPIRPLWGVVAEVDLGPVPTRVLEEAGIDDTIGVTDAARPEASAEGPDAGAQGGVEFSLVPGPFATVVGSTFLPREPAPEDWVERILLRASRFVPGLADSPIRGVRACARPQSADGRPLVGAVPGIGGLYVCAGHGAWGISIGPGSSRLVADLILGREPVIPPELDPARFGRPRD